MDVNLLNTFQQVVIYLCSMVTNPITINSSVVFLRLYWFERRFQNIVQEARLRRGTISKTKSRARENRDLEMGVNGRSITVMHNKAKSRITNDGILLDSVADNTTSGENAAGPDRESGLEAPPAKSEPHEDRQPEIRFAQTVKRSDGLGEDATKLPPGLPDEHHVTFLDRQRNPPGDEVLRIPGPRDAERGMRPERIVDNEDVERGSPRDRRPSVDSTTSEPPRAAETRPQAITIEEPQKLPRAEELADGARAAANVLSTLRLRKPRILSGKEQRLHREEDAVHITPTSMPKRRPTLETFRTALSREKEEAPYLSWEPVLGRNSAFPGLTEDQKEELGGIEYRSLKTLGLVLTSYFWGFSALGVLCLLPWIIESSTYGPIVDSVSQSRTWWGFFTPNSAFMDLGYTLTPDSMNSFNTATFPLLLMSFLIVIGNTGFPVMLRFIIWVSSLVVPRGTGLYEELRFLLDHPRRCFTLLFPSVATWWLFWVLVVLNGLDLVFFIVLDVGAPYLCLRC